MFAFSTVLCSYTPDSFTLSYFFSFYYSAAPPDLHSFPTRRSSDLGPLRPPPRPFSRDDLPPQRPGRLPGPAAGPRPDLVNAPDRKSTRLNSSHVSMSYAVFCLTKKKKNKNTPRHQCNTIINMIHT